MASHYQSPLNHKLTPSPFQMKPSKRKFLSFLCCSDDALDYSPPLNSQNNNQIESFPTMKSSNTHNYLEDSTQLYSSSNTYEAPQDWKKEQNNQVIRNERASISKFDNSTLKLKFTDQIKRPSLQFNNDDTPFLLSYYSNEFIFNNISILTRNTHRYFNTEENQIRRSINKKNDINNLVNYLANRLSCNIIINVNSNIDHKLYAQAFSNQSLFTISCEQDMYLCQEIQTFVQNQKLKNVNIVNNMFQNMVNMFGDVIFIKPKIKSTSKLKQIIDIIEDFETNLEEVIQFFSKVCDRIYILFPHNIDAMQVSLLFKNIQNLNKKELYTVEIEHIYSNKQLTNIGVYFGSDSIKENEIYHSISQLVSMKNSSVYEQKKFAKKLINKLGIIQTCSLIQNFLQISSDNIYAKINDYLEKKLTQLSDSEVETNDNSVMKKEKLSSLKERNTMKLITSNLADSIQISKDFSPVMYSYNEIQLELQNDF